MKLTAALLAPAIIVGASTMALAEADYSRIKKDVMVMSGILGNSFDSEQARGRISVDGNYLARQGAVFTVRAPRSMNFSLAFSSDDDNVFVYDGYDIAIPAIPAIPAVPAVPGISEIAADALADVQREFEAHGIEWTGDQDHYAMRMEIDNETRNAMRELGREMREMEREISEYRISLIHVDDNDEKKEIEQRITEIRNEMSELADKHARLEENLKREREKYEARRAEAKQKAEEARKARIAMVEKHVMQSFCDYGSTLKNLPSDEHVSVIVSRSEDKDDRKIYVFDKNDVVDCRSADALAKKATSYMF